MNPWNYRYLSISGNGTQAFFHVHFPYYGSIIGQPPKVECQGTRL